MIHKSILFILALFFLLQETYAQSVDDNLVKLADEMYGFGDKKDALAVYLQAIELNSENIRANYMAGKCYLETVDKEQSVKFLIKTLELNKDYAPDLLFDIASGYQLGSKFDQAIAYYKKYKETMNDAKAKKLKSSLSDEIIKTDRRIYECDNAKLYTAHPIKYKIENLGEIVNSEYPDYAPAISSDQSVMVFTSRRSGGVGKNKDIDNEYFEDVWITRKKNNEWEAPKNIGKPINTTSHDASIGFSADGKVLFIYNTINGGDIYFSKQMPDGKWSEPKEVSGINSRAKEPSVSISADGKVLYFSSDRSGGFGRLDLYRSELQPNGKWGRPVSLGSSINTEYDEDSPYIDIDGKTLYFSSRGHKGMGGYDIYKTIYDPKRKVWSAPENMGFPINSPDDDIYFVIAGDHQTGYYASAKGDGYGDKDIYMIDLKPIEEEVPLKKDTTVAAKKDTVKPAVAVKKPLPKDTLAKQAIAPPKAIAKDALAKQMVPPTKALVKDTTKPVARDTSERKRPAIVKRETPSSTATSATSSPPIASKSPTESTPPILAPKPETAPVAASPKPVLPPEEPKATPEKLPTSAERKEASQDSGISPGEATPTPVAEKPKAIQAGAKAKKPAPAKALPVYFPTVVKGSITDFYTDNSLEATIVVQDLKGNVIKTIHTENNGKYSFEYTSTAKSTVIITATKDDYIYANINLNIPPNAKKQAVIIRDFALKPIEKGEVFVLRNIYYDFGKSIIKKESFPYLEKLCSWLKTNPNIQLEIGGHTDNFGLPNYNNVLSQSRVNAVKKWLTAKGIQEERLIPVGYGESRPLASNDDEMEGREINRRTEFKVLRK